jgi:hypothetical protein
MIASFFIGLMGGLFITNNLRILINSLIAPIVLKNEKNCLRILISQESLNALKDIKIV